MRLCAFLILLALAAKPGLGRELVYLTSGFSITVDSHTQLDNLCVMHVGNGTIEYPLNQISEIVVLSETPATKSGASVQIARNPEAILNQAARQEGVDSILVRAVAKVESGLRQEAISNKGALGLMQLMPQTAAEMGVDPKQAVQNASGGARYLRSLLERYHYNPVLALAAYNSGPGTVLKYGGVPPYYETRTYVVRVLKEYQKQLKAAGLLPDGSLATNPSETAPKPSTKKPIATN